MNNSITLGQVQVYPGQPEKNLQIHLNAIQQAKDEGSSMIILPEMWIPGYMLGDQYDESSFLEELEEMNQDIIAATQSTHQSFTAIWGNITVDKSKKGRHGYDRRYNSAYIASNGRLVSNWVTDWVVHKSLLPDYRYFDDSRYFHPMKKLAKEEGKSLSEYYKPFEIEIDGVKQKVSLLICEDIWNINGDYANNPVEMAKAYNPNLLAVISASPFWIKKDNMRERVLKQQSKDIKLAYVNPIWIQNNWKNILTFEWASGIYENGVKKIWTPEYQSWNFTDNTPESLPTGNENMEKIYNTLIFSIKEFMKSIGQDKIVIWLSGGLDSAVTTALCVAALWSENVITVNMPSNYNTGLTKGYAKEIADTLGTEYRITPIQELVDLHQEVLNNDGGKNLSDFDMQNVQARIRWASILSGIAAKEWAVYTNNGNKSEVAMWYATLYWDVNGSFAPIADLYKSQVRELAHYINIEFGETIIPESLIDMQPTAELGEWQNPEEGEGDPFNYEYLDKLLYQFIEMRKAPVDILEMYIDGTIQEKLWLDTDITPYYQTPEEFIVELEKIYTDYKINFFKRVQAPPIMTLSKRSFGFDLREAQNGVYFKTRKYKRLLEQLK